MNPTYQLNRAVRRLVLKHGLIAVSRAVLMHAKPGVVPAERFGRLNGPPEADRSATGKDTPLDRALAAVDSPDSHPEVWEAVRRGVETGGRVKIAPQERPTGPNRKG